MSEEASLDEADLLTFKQNVIEYIQIPEQLKKLAEPIKQLKARQKVLEEDVQDFMRQNEISQCKIPEEQGGGVLALKSSTRKTAMKKDNWTLGISNFLKKRKIPDVTPDDVLKEVEDTRDLETKFDLKRVKR